MRHLLLLFAIIVMVGGPASAQRAFFDDTATFTYKPGFFDLYVDPDEGDVYAALPKPDPDGISLRFIYANGLTAGLGSNPIGLDRGAATSGVIIRFRRIGNRIIAEQENWRYRATAERPEERRAVAQSFAPSFLWSTDIVSESLDGRLLIDLSSFLTRDQFGVADSLKHGQGAAAYSLAKDRSFPDPTRSFAFPDNVELDAFLTFDTAAANAQTGATAADGRSVTLVLHHSFIRLPDDGYTPRGFDQRTANIGMGYYDYSAPLDAPIITRLSRRFRLERVDPYAASGPVVKPIVFYVDNGAPQDIRDALIDGASWWAEGFEAAGFEGAYRVELLPEDAHPLDVRYNVINWVHRQTRGWSYGGSVSDPRTGEILKANVILGSQRVRQDRMIFEGLAGTEKTGTGAPDDPIVIALSRIRQLSAHEVGHTLGFAHNFAASTNDRASVMDYPAPFVRPFGSNALDFSEAYGVGLGDWDIFTVKWLYSQYPDGVDGSAVLSELVDEAYGSGLRFVGDRHGRSTGEAHPYASVWDNGSDPISMLRETMTVRQIALDSFDQTRIADGQTGSDINAVIVPIYLYHRYQVAAAAKYVGGLNFQYSINGDGSGPATLVDDALQREALSALLETIDPAALNLPETLLNLLTPGDVGYAGTAGAAETFPGRTGAVFDLLSAADSASTLTVSALLHPDRAERLVAYAQRDQSRLGLSDMLSEMSSDIFDTPTDQRLRRIAHTVQHRYVSALIGLSQRSRTSSQVRAEVDFALRSIGTRLSRRNAARSADGRRHNALLVRLIDSHFEGETIEMLSPSPLATPPGSPIGSGESCWHCYP